MSAEDIILGSDITNISVNLITVLIKYYIYSCRFTTSQPCLAGVIKSLKKAYDTEKLSSYWYKSPAVRERIEQKWQVIHNAIN